MVCGLMLNELYAFYGWQLQLSLMDQEGFPVWRQILGVLLVCLIARVWIQPLLLGKKSFRNY